MSAWVGPLIKTIFVSWIAPQSWCQPTKPGVNNFPMTTKKAFEHIWYCPFITGWAFLFSVICCHMVWSSFIIHLHPPHPHMHPPTPPHLHPPHSHLHSPHTPHSYLHPPHITTSKWGCGEGTDKGGEGAGGSGEGAGGSGESAGGSEEGAGGSGESAGGSGGGKGAGGGVGRVQVEGWGGSTHTSLHTHPPHTPTTHTPTTPHAQCTRVVVILSHLKVAI